MGNAEVLSLGLLALIASGCMVGPEWETGAPAGPGASEEALTTVVFTGLDEWTTGPLVSGDAARVDYVMADAEACASSVVMFYRSDDSEETELPLTIADDGSSITATFVVPEGRELALRFVAEGSEADCVGLVAGPEDYRFPIDVAPMDL